MDGRTTSTYLGSRKGVKNNIVSHYHSARILFVKPLYHVKEFQKNVLVN